MALPTTVQPKQYIQGEHNYIPHSNVTNYNTTTNDGTNNNKPKHLHTHGLIPVLHTSTEVATRDVLWTMTLCDGVGHAGICVDQQMQNNDCIPTPIMRNDVSVYLPDRTACQVYNNDHCHLGAPGEVSLYIARDYDDLRGMQRRTGIDFLWMSWVCHNSIGE
ncbi:hypothetical protein EG328_005232 [Venturia inaequalis]|uniref:Uncharacterized protein n=1 Tax=Venturia inaequalis TaxID=5025 RepID=A0A8H3VFB0_VENIN|nr:hypothetical protein EG328_005232 [Venturia inaequalis]